MSLQQTKRRPLTWDPLADVPDGYTSYFEWAIDHETQDKNDWCWIACLRNALTCFGRYPKQEEILEQFHHPEPGDSSKEKGDDDDDRIPLERIAEVWRSYGFTRAAPVSPQDDPLSFEALATEITSNGPVLIELWRKETEEYHHLALICGVRVRGDRREVCISDPKDTTTQWITDEQLRGPTPLMKSKFGPWRRTYVGLTYEKKGYYLRRFFDLPARALVALGTEENGGAPDNNPTKNGSLLEFDRVLRPDPPLTSELTLACYGYRCYRLRDAEPAEKEQRQADLEQPLFLHESIRMYRPASDLDYQKDLRDQLELQHWHHQIHGPKGPRYYARTLYFEPFGGRPDEAWRADWLGERWLARQVADCIAKLDSDPDLAKRAERVRMIRFRSHGLVTLLLTESNLHLVVSANDDRQATFPLLGRFTDEQLRAALAELEMGA